MTTESFRLPVGMKDDFNEMTHKLGDNKSEILRDAIEDYLIKNRRRAMKIAS